MYAIRSYYVRSCEACVALLRWLSEPDAGVHAAQVQVALRERDLDIGLAQCFLNGKIEFTHGGKALIRNNFV